MRHSLVLCIALVLPATLPAFSQSTPKPAEIVRKEQGNRITENAPEIPADLVDELNRNQNTRGAALAGWTGQGCLLTSTRFAETAQVHRVCQPLGVREQLTFYSEPVAGITPSPR